MTAVMTEAKAEGMEQSLIVQAEFSKTKVCVQVKLQRAYGGCLGTDSR